MLAIGRAFTHLAARESDLRESPMTDSLRDRIGAAIGHQYQIETEIGRGGMSVVYQARDLRLNRRVAIKVLPPELAHDAAVASRFTREAQTSAQLSHPHIVPIYDVGEQDGVAYFVMALVTGGNLAAVLEHQPRRPIDEVRRLLREVADALSYAHLRGVVHRDIKADNILLEGDSGRAIVTDFGIARAMESGSRLTATGIAVGTPTYMSPEQAVGERELDGRSDIYSLGVLGYQMLTGRVPFAAGNPMALLLKHVTERPRPILELRPEVPRALCDVVERALMKAPEDRWPTAAEFRDALAVVDAPQPAWRTDHREPVRYTSPVPRSGNRDARPPAMFMVPRRDDKVADRALLAEPALPAAVARAARSPGEIVRVPEHLALLTNAQREDLRLWNGRIDLLDRVKSARRYAWLTLAMTGIGLAALAGAGDAPPLILSPLVPIYMWVKLRRRGLSLRERGLRLRRVYLALRARSVLPAPPALPTERQLEILVPRDVLDGARGAVIRRAVEDRAACLAIMANLSKADRALLPDITPTTNALVERVAQLAQTLHRLDGDIDPRLMADLDARIAGGIHDDGGGSTDERQRRLALLNRQRGTIEELVQRRAALARQLDNAALALGNLRLDLIKLRSSGVESALRDVSTATQEARALSREIETALDIASEMREL
jgi:serine/threonine protein kinase